MPCRLHILDFTMIGSWPKDCLMMPLGTPLIDQLTSAWVDANHNQLKKRPEVLSCSHPQFRSLVGQSLSLALPCLDTSQTYHQLPFVWTSSPPALCWKHLYIPADAPFGDHRVVDGGLNKREADPVIFERKLQRGDGLRKRCHKKMRNFLEEERWQKVTQSNTKHVHTGQWNRQWQGLQQATRCKLSLSIETRNSANQIARLYTFSCYIKMLFKLLGQFGVLRTMCYIH